LVPGLVLTSLLLVSASAFAQDVDYEQYTVPYRPYAVPPPARPAPPPPPPPPVIVRERDPYDTPGNVIAGAGFGGLILKGDQGSTVAPVYQLHLGLAVGASEFALRTSLIPDAFEDSGLGDVALYATRATFDYRFIPGAVVHPVAGFGLESIVSSPTKDAVGHSFAATVRVGLELAFPLQNAALALGIDTHGHLPFARTQSFPSELSAMIGFGAYMDYRF
jgi:hypothetical protein